jgi:5,5'-dehydrodivanillate O-demethylase
MRQDLKRKISIDPLLDANWLQAMENSVDPAHLEILHQESGSRHGDNKPANTTRGNIDDVESYDFYLTSFGIMKRRVLKDGRVDEHPLVFPNILRRSGTQVRVPVDDTHTLIFHISLMTGKDTPDTNYDDPPVRYAPPIKEPPDKRYPEATYRMDNVPSQDMTMWETEGEIFDRTQEHLSYSDRGIVMFRKLLLENIEKVQRGEDPMGVIRDPNHPMIDTELETSEGWPGWKGRPQPMGM